MKRLLLLSSVVLLLGATLAQADLITNVTGTIKPNTISFTRGTATYTFGGSTSAYNYVDFFYADWMDTAHSKIALLEGVIGGAEPGDQVFCDKRADYTWPGGTVVGKTPQYDEDGNIIGYTYTLPGTPKSYINMLNLTVPGDPAEYPNMWFRHNQVDPGLPGNNRAYLYTDFRTGGTIQGGDSANYLQTTDNSATPGFNESLLARVFVNSPTGDVTFSSYFIGLTSGETLQGSFSTAIVPEPGTIALLATGLMGLLCYAWRKRK